MEKMLFSALVLCVLSYQVLAVPVYHSPRTLLEDDAVNIHRDVDGDGLISAGDSILGVMEFDSTQSTIPGGFSTPIPEELTGVYDAYVVSVSAPNAFGRVDIVFGANPGGFFSTATDPNLAAEVAQAQGGGAGLIGGEILRLFNGAPNDLDLSSVNCLTTKDCLNLASNGQFYMSFGDDGDDNFNFMLQNGVQDPTVLKTIAQATSTGFANFNMNLIDNQTGEIFNKYDCLPSFCNPGDDNQVQMTGSAVFYGGLGLPGVAMNRGDIQIILERAEINEPESLALLGVGLLGLGFTSRRKNK